MKGFIIYATRLRGRQHPGLVPGTDTNMVFQRRFPEDLCDVRLLENPSVALRARPLDEFDFVQEKAFGNICREGRMFLIINGPQNTM